MNAGNDGTYHFLVQIVSVGIWGRLLFRESLKRAMGSPKMRLRHRDCDSFGVGRIVSELKTMEGIEQGGRATMCRFRHMRRCCTSWLNKELRDD